MIVERYDKMGHRIQGAIVPRARTQDAQMNLVSVAWGLGAFVRPSQEADLAVDFIIDSDEELDFNKKMDEANTAAAPQEGLPSQ